MTTTSGWSNPGDDFARVAAAVAAPPSDPSELLRALVTLRELQERMAGWEAPLIAAARASGVSWAELAPPLGLSSRQAAERRFLRLQPPGAADARTGEERVRDERDRRAGDRAVAAWARSNSGSLRRLAGQVGALADVPGAAGVQDALGDDDASSLIAPLAAAGPDLPSELARQVRDLTDQVADLRRTTTEGRRRS
jgi:hypothetical protein